jgi:hypothetical protein
MPLKPSGLLSNTSSVKPLSVEGELLDILSKEPLFIVFKRDKWATPKGRYREDIESELCHE